MRTRSVVRLTLEQLEDRWVPATVKLVSGNLIISDPRITAGAASLTLTRNATGQFKVEDSGSILGTYTVNGNVLVLGSNAKDAISVELAGNTFAGNLLVLAGNGNDTLTLNKTTAGGVIGGNITLLTGLGDDSVSANTTAGALTVGGSLLAADPAGKNTLQLGNGTATTTIGGDVNVTGYADNGATKAVAIGAGKADRIGGNLTVQSVQTGNNVSVVLGVAAQGVTVGKQFTVTTGAGSDSVIINGTVAGAGTTIGGNTHANLGDGNNYFINSAATFTKFNGDVTYLAGAGNDSFALGGSGAVPSTEVAGNLNLDLGEGNNNFGDAIAGGGNFGVAGTAPVVFGDVNITAGNGNNTLDGMGITVQGNLTFNFGNGNNIGTVLVPMVVARQPGGKLIWRSGNGTNALQVANPFGGTELFNVDVQFGNGNDTFIVGGAPFGGANFGVVTGRVDGGGQVTADTFLQDPAWTLSPLFQLSNFP